MKDSYQSMGESSQHAPGEGSHPQGPMQSEATYVKCPERAMSRDRKQVAGCQGLGGGMREQ